MTTESYFIILVFVLLLFKFLISTDKKAGLIAIKSSLLSFRIIPDLAFFFIALLSTMKFSHQAIGVAVIVATAWVLFRQFLKKINYQTLSWWALIINVAYVASSYLGVENVPNQTVWYLILFSWGFTFILILILDIFKKLPKVISILFTGIYSWVLLLIPINYISYFITFGNSIAEGQINAIFQTTISESIEFFGQHGSFLNVFLISSLLALTLTTIIYQVKQSTKPIGRQVFILFSVAIIFIASLNILPQLPMINLIFTSIETYERELAEFKMVLEKRKSGDINFTATKEDEKELVIVIIGESLNKNHMGIYGYHRNTTPNLSKLYAEGNLLKFEQAFSNHVHTVSTLTFSLTEATQLNNFKYNNSLSILDIQDAAGYTSYWISNQVAYGGWDNPVSVLAERADFRYNLNNNIGLNTNTSALDIQLVDKLAEILEEPITENTVIYLHLMGNHGGYKNRYPKEFMFYHEPFQTKNYGSKNYWHHHINEYDNSVLYNDYIVSEIIKLADQQTINTTCIYFSDHSEDVLDNNGHNQGSFTFSMTQTPMLIWFSDAYKQTYSEKVENLKQHQDSLFSNGFVYDLLIGMSDIRTDHYTPEHDLSSATYKLDIKDSYTLHGEHAINENSNYFYHEKNNVKTIKQRGELNRVFPHRINTIGALSTILYDGCKSFELDLVFQGMGDAAYFEVGHGENEMSGMKFEEMLAFSKSYGIQRIWMDIKNINEQNLSSVLKRLQKLDETYDLKPKLIVETSMVKEAFSIFSESGFHTSYYIPTHYNDYDDAAKANVARDIAKQVVLQKVSAISFDFALYPFVKKFIEPKLDSQIVYHTWNVSYGFQNPDLIDKLDNSDYYRDPRVKTILVKYQNNFEL